MKEKYLDLDHKYFMLKTEKEEEKEKKQAEEEA